MLTLLLGLLLDTGAQAHALAADSFRDRTAATRRLKGYGPLALPAVAVASCSRDPERRHRAAKLLAPWPRRCEEASDALLLAWIAHHPGDDWPSDAWAGFLGRMDLPRWCRLVRLAHAWGLAALADEDRDRPSWAHDVRWRARAPGGAP